MFWLALHGYIGTDLCLGAKQATKIRLHDEGGVKDYFGVPVRSLILFGIFLLMAGGWGE
jgi:hypothetical protein